MRRRVNTLTIQTGLCKQDWSRNQTPLPPELLGYWTRFEVDGRCIEGDLPSDFGSVVQATTHSIKRNGSGILTCRCGVPYCAGIEECVRVHHQGRYVYWTYLSPIVAGFGTRNVREWKCKARKVRFRFLRGELMQTCKAAAIALNVQADADDVRQGFIGADTLHWWLARGRGRWLFPQ